MANHKRNCSDTNFAALNPRAGMRVSDMRLAEVEDMEDVEDVEDVEEAEEVAAMEEVEEEAEAAV